MSGCVTLSGGRVRLRPWRKEDRNPFAVMNVDARVMAFYHRSGPVMEWLGMRRNHADDLDYPTFPEGHPLRRRVLYRLGSGPCAGGTWRPGSAARGRVGQATPDQPEMTTV